MTDKFQSNLKNLIEEFNFYGHKKFNLIVLLGLLGDFDSFEYAINLKCFINYSQKSFLTLISIKFYMEKFFKKLI